MITLVTMSVLSKLIPSYFHFQIVTNDLQISTVYFSNPAAQCLQIRTRSFHMSSATMSVKLVHYNGDNYAWGASERFGFHCFHHFEGNGRCDDFEYRIFTNCW